MFPLVSDTVDRRYSSTIKRDEGSSILIELQPSSRRYSTNSFSLFFFYLWAILFFSSRIEGEFYFHFVCKKIFLLFLSRWKFIIELSYL